MAMFTSRTAQFSQHRYWAGLHRRLTVPAAATAETPDTEPPPCCAMPRMSTLRLPVPAAMAVKVMLATLMFPPCWELEAGCRMLFIRTLVALPRALHTKVRLVAGQSAPAVQSDSLATDRMADG